MTHEEKEQVLREYRAKEREIMKRSMMHRIELTWPRCFYCGARHSSDSCRSPERDEWWRDEREAIR